MKIAHVVLSLLLAFPAAAYAQQPAATFANDSIFLSKSSVTEGDKVLIYTSIANPTGTSFDGTIAVQEGKKPIGSITISLDAGEAQVVSIPWKPQAGVHIITAQLKRSDGSEASSASATFTIAPKPQEEGENAEKSAAIQTSAPIQQQIGSISPIAASYAAPVFNAIDSGRARAVQTLDTQLSQTKEKLPGKIFNTNASSGNSIAATGKGIGWTLYFYALSIVRFLLGSIILFYPLLVLAFFWLLYKLYRRMTRPKWVR